MSFYKKYKREDINVYSGFHPFWQWVLDFWSGHIVNVDNPDQFFTVIDDLNRDLEKNNVIVFFDHHYAFDAAPIGVLLANAIQNLRLAIVPYAVHLEMGVGRDGEFSLHYWFRTQMYRWFVSRVMQGDLEIRFLPVVREFEMETHRLRKIVDQSYKGINTNYIRSFIRGFSENQNGAMCFLSPFSGIGFPGKPTLHHQLFRSIEMVRAKTRNDVSFFITGAYPSWEAYRNYQAPLLTSHNIIIQGPFSLPGGNYDNACDNLSTKLEELRKAANFIPPDYSKILLK